MFVKLKRKRTSPPEIQVLVKRGDFKHYYKTNYCIILYELNLKVFKVLRNITQKFVLILVMIISLDFLTNQNHNVSEPHLNKPVIEYCNR